jgi:protein CpxP
MTATTRNGLGIATLATIAVLTFALAGVHAQNTGSGTAPATQGGRGGPDGPGRGFGRGPGGPGGPMGPLGLIHRLELSDAQREQVKSLMDSRRNEGKAVADRARSAHEALQAAVSADTFDEGAIRARGAEVAIADADMAVAQGRLYADVLQILTPEQRTQLKTLEAKMKERRGERQGRR